MVEIPSGVVKCLSTQRIDPNAFNCLLNLIGMGRSGRNRRRSSRMSDSDDDILSTSSTGESLDLTLTHEVGTEMDESALLEIHLDALYEKRSSTRESGLNALINAFTSNIQLEFAVSKYETLLHQCVVLIKRGSASEAALASHALGLLAITVGAGKIAHRVIEEANPHLGHVAKFGSNPATRISALESLAIVTFIGANDVEETQKSMDIFWQISGHYGSDHADQALGTTKPPPGVKASAISSWCFLLTTIPRQQISSHFVKQSLSVLLSVLDMDDRAVRIAAGEAITLIFERSNHLDDNGFGPSNSISGGEERGHLPGGRLPLDDLEAEVIEKMRVLSIEAGGKGSSRKDLSSQRNSFREFLAYIKDGVKSETTVKLQKGDAVKISSWSQTIQLNALRGFLGGGFQKHMQANSLLHDIFDFIPRQEKQQAFSTKQKRMYMSPNSIVSKARTQQLNKLRTIAQAGNYGHYGIGVNED